MNPFEIIDTYADDVARRLPRRQRSDVAAELRSLLRDELEGRAADSGRPADEAMVLDLLRSFGAPDEVADRYRPAGFTVIRPADAPAFAWIALIGVAAQWALTLPGVFIGADEPWGRLAAWWLSWGLGAFWWPGFLVTMSLIAGWVGSRRGERVWSPRVVDRDRVNRGLYVLYIALGVVGASIVISLPWLAVWATWLPQPVIDAFAFDAEFLAWRAVWVLPLWLALLALSIVVLAAGRWSRTTRRVALVIDAAWIVVCVWWVASGPVFVNADADGVTRLALILVAVLALIELVRGVRRELAGRRTPVVTVGPRAA
ncbi:hypothetical protein MN032_02985 [Agromyces atrinae]|uniref:hypothetical protein n=1 Tax=Agromyces atrinae TaxID=592376 RepID=UPI001F5A020E|nr:hypothetical protein [Agromyces atrinae]MCI2956648.1 hypothetical protein [Agromyces atrinae]